MDVPSSSKLFLNAFCLSIIVEIVDWITLPPIFLFCVEFLLCCGASAVVFVASSDAAEAAATVRTAFTTLLARPSLFRAREALPTLRVPTLVLLRGLLDRLLT